MKTKIYNLDMFEYISYRIKKNIFINLDIKTITHLLI